MTKLNTKNTSSMLALMCCLMMGTSIALANQQQQQQQQLAEHQVLCALQAAQSEAGGEESYQRVYEAFTKLAQNVSNNSLGNARRLVSRLNQLVGSGGSQQEAAASRQQTGKEQQRQQQQQQSNDEKTEQILNRLDQVNKDTDQHTIRQLQEDVNRLVGSLNDSYLRNIRRLIERMDRVVGRPSGGSSAAAASAKGETEPLHQSSDRFQEGENNRPPGFPGWDELIVAVDRMQKSLASFVRSSTKLITSGRR